MILQNVGIAVVLQLHGDVPFQESCSRRRVVDDLNRPAEKASLFVVESRDRRLRECKGTGVELMRMNDAVGVQPVLVDGGMQSAFDRRFAFSPEDTEIIPKYADICWCHDRVIVIGRSNGEGVLATNAHRNIAACPHQIYFIDKVVTECSDLLLCFLIIPHAYSPMTALCERRPPNPPEGSRHRQPQEPADSVRSRQTPVPGRRSCSGR